MLVRSVIFMSNEFALNKFGWCASVGKVHVGILFTSFYFRQFSLAVEMILMRLFFYPSSPISRPCDMCKPNVIWCCSCEKVVMFSSAALRQPFLSHKHFHKNYRWQHDFNSFAQVGSIVICVARRRNQLFTLSALIALTIHYRWETCQRQREKTWNLFRWKTSIHV